MKENKIHVLFVGWLKEIVWYYHVDIMLLVLNVLKLWKIVLYVEHLFMILYRYLNLK